jgi:multidrug resistance efflux pump
MAEQRDKLDEILPSYSAEVQDILGHVPNWIIRWGITVITLILVAFLTAAWVFRYPDMITAAVIVSGENPPAPVMARVEGRLRQLLVEDGRVVAAGESLAVLENPAISDDALGLQRRLADLPADWIASPEVLANIDFPRKLTLGDCQPAYEEFYRAGAEYRLFRRLQYHQNKIASLRRQQAAAQEIAAHLGRQVTLLQEEYELLQKQFERSEELYRSGIVSSQDLETARAQLLQKEYALSGGRSALANARLSMEQMAGELLDLTLQEREKNQQLLTQLQQALRNLGSQLAQWDQTYVLRAPVAGKVSFTLFWSSNQYVKLGDKVMTVAPPGAVRLIGKVQLPLDGAGKVKTGQRVNLRFADYPYIEFGTVPGVVRGKSLVFSEGYYTVDIDLPRGLRTNYGRELPYTQQLQGQAEIITDDIRLLTRLFNPLRALLKRQAGE